MAKPKRAVEEVAQQLNLRIGGGGVAYGILDGYLVQLTPGLTENGKACVYVLLWFDPRDREAAPILQSVVSHPNLSAADVALKRVGIDNGALIYTQIGAFSTGSISSEKLRGAAQALLTALKPAAPPPPNTCEHCGATEPGPPRLINGAATRVCGPCIVKMETAAREAQDAYDAQPTRFGLALLAAGASAVVGAVVWAGLGIMTERMFALVGIGAGLLVGFATLYAAGRGHWIVQVITFVGAIASVLLGELMWVAYALNQAAQAEHVEVDWGAFVQATPEILGSLGSDTFYSLACGIGGAVGAFFITARQKVQFQVD